MVAEVDPTIDQMSNVAVVVTDDENPVPSNGEDGDAQKQKRRNNKRDERPIEELFDLSKPIPKVEKPDKDKFEKELQELTDAIESLKNARVTIQDKIDSTVADADAKSGLQVARLKLNELKSTKNALIEEKKVMRAQMDAAKTQTDKLLNEKKSTRGNVKFNSTEEIDNEIRRLQRKQETTSMSLNEEKRLIKEIETLKSSKKYVVDLKNTDASIDDVKEQKKNIMQLITSKDKEIDEITKQVKEVMETIEGLNAKDSLKKEAIAELFKERDDLKKQMNLKIAEKDALRTEFREKTDAFYSYQRAVRKQKQMQIEEEKRRREEEKAAYLAKIEAEEAKKIPYEEEQGLCEFLADYLERTYLKKDSEEKDENGNKKADVVDVKDNPFSGLQPVNKKNDDEEYFGKGKGKKKRVRQTKKQDTVAGPFTLSVDTFEQFGLIQLTPPISIDQVEQSVKELREKKEWYKNQPRGSVPTATEIRKANEKAAMKLRTEVDSGLGSKQSTTGKGKSNAGKNFSLANEDFAPLGAATVSSSTLGINSSWGKVSVSVSSEAPTPAEAAASAAGGLEGVSQEEQEVM